MLRLAAFSSMTLSTSAFAHELPGPHDHPHGDWASTIGLALAAVTLCLLVLAYARGRK